MYLLAEISCIQVIIEITCLSKSFDWSMLMCIQILVKFCPLVLKILSGNEILTSIKGRNSVVNLRNLTLFYNPNLDIIYVNVYTKFG